jgi:hypothetical protein
MTIRVFTRAILSLMFASLLFAFMVSFARAQRPSSSQASGQDSGQQGRIAPPAGLKCSRDNMTSFTGRVLAYQRSQARVFIRVRTDEATTESFTLRLPKSGNAAGVFLLNGEPFKQRDWSKVELSKGTLRSNMRATVWACYQGNEPKPEVIDWRPPEN